LLGPTAAVLAGRNGAISRIGFEGQASCACVELMIAASASLSLGLDRLTLQVCGSIWSAWHMRVCML
jgi:hypothetical protein